MKLLRPFPRKVELAILGVVTLVCTNSAYQLFMAPSGTPAANGANRSPAARVSRGESFQTLDLGCLKEDMRLPVGSDRIRIKAALCPTKGRSPAGWAVPKLFMVENPRSHHRAEVYFEKTWPQFTTDFIPLASGTNEIRLHVTESGGVSREFKVYVQKN